MPKKPADSKRRRKVGSQKQNGKIEINTNGAYITGNVNTAGGDFAGHDLHKSMGLSSDDVSRLFKRFYEAVEARSNTGPSEKTDLKAELEEVEEEVAKGDKANETFLSRRLRNIGRMAPDIFDVVLTTLAQPASGLALVVRKVAEKMKNVAVETKL